MISAFSIISVYTGIHPDETIQNFILRFSIELNWVNVITGTDRIVPDRIISFRIGPKFSAYPCFAIKGGGAV